MSVIFKGTDSGTSMHQAPDELKNSSLGSGAHREGCMRQRKHSIYVFFVSQIVRYEQPVEVGCDRKSL